MRLFRSILYSNIWIAFIGCGITFFIQHSLGNDMPILVWVFIFIAIFIAYNAMRIWQMKDYNKELISEHHKFMISHKETLKWASLLALAICSICLFFLPIYSLLLLSIPAIISALYVFPIPVFGKKIELRKVPYSKAIWVAICWAFMSCIFPVSIISKSSLYSHYIWVYFGICAFYFWALTIPFDIRDQEQDQGNKLKTVYEIWGFNGIKKGVLLSFFICSLGLSYLFYFDQIAWTAYVSWGIGITTSIWVIFKTHSSKKDIWYDAILDGSILILPIVDVLLSCIETFIRNS